MRGQLNSRYWIPQIALLLLLCAGGACSAQQSATVAIPPDVSLPTPVPPSGQLTLDQAEAAAKANNLVIAQARYQTAGARDNLTGQTAPINPTLNYSSLNNTVAPASGFGTATNYSAYATVETNGAERLRTNQARAEWQGAQDNEEVTRLSVEQAVADAYSNLQVVNSQLQNELNVYDLTRQLRDLTEQQFKLGAAPQTNAFRAEIALEQEKQNLIAAVTQVQQARIALNVQLGRAPNTPIDASEPLTYNPVASPEQAKLLSLAGESRPEVRAATASVSAAEANVGLQKSAYTPNLLLGYGFGLNQNQLQVGFVLPLDLGSIRGAVNTARDNVKAQQAAEEQARLSVSQDVENAYTNLVQAQQTVDSYQTGILPQSESLLSRVTQGYSLGANSILDVIDAQQTYRATRNSYYAAVGAYNAAVDQLNRAAGMPVTKPIAGAGQPATPETTAPLAATTPANAATAPYSSQLAPK